MAAPLWTCSPHPRNGDDPLGSITVGTVFRLDCLSSDAASSLNLDGKKIQIKAPETQPYALHLIAVQDLSVNRARLLVTTYQAGQLKLRGFEVTDGQNSFTIPDFDLQVQSVIDQKNNPEMKPYGPVAGQFLALPEWIWIFIALALFAILATFGFWLKTRLRRRAFLKRLNAEPIAGTPFRHFSKELRGLMRKIPASDTNRPEAFSDMILVREIDFSLRWYLARRLRYDFLRGSDRQALLELKSLGRRKRSAKLLEQVSAIRSMLSELAQVQKNKKTLSGPDLFQLIELCRKTVDHLELALREVAL